MSLHQQQLAVDCMVCEVPKMVLKLGVGSVRFRSAGSIMPECCLSYTLSSFLHEYKA